MNKFSLGIIPLKKSTCQELHMYTCPEYVLYPDKTYKYSENSYKIRQGGHKP